MNFREKIRAARSKIDALKSELATFEEQGISRPEIEDLVSELITSFAIEGRTQRQRALDRLSHGIPAGLFHVRATGATVSGEPVNVTLDMGPILTQLLGEDIMQQALQSALSGMSAGLAPDVKESRRKAILADLEALQAKEESHIRDAELTGEVIPRRPDAEARFVLALDGG